MSLPEPETHGHGSAQGAREAIERGDVDTAAETLARGMSWTADMVVAIEARLIALEEWAREKGFEEPAIRGDGD